MSNTLYRYKQRCDETERQLADMTAERDHYFNQAEHFRCELLRATEERSLDDPLLARMHKALDGLAEVTLDEAIAAMGLHEPSRPLQVRASICLRELGWARHEIRDACPRFVFRRPQAQNAGETPNDEGQPGNPRHD